MEKKDIKKVVLAYSGGLDTTAIIPWLKENFDYEVICCCIDCGQGEELDGLEERAKLSGASKLYIENIIDAFEECAREGEEMDFEDIEDANAIMPTGEPFDISSAT